MAIPYFEPCFNDYQQLLTGTGTWKTTENDAGYVPVLPSKKNYGYGILSTNTSAITLGGPSMSPGLTTLTTDSLSVNVKKKYVHLLEIVALYIGSQDIKDRIVYLDEKTSVINNSPNFVDTQIILLEHAAKINKALEEFNEKNKFLMDTEIVDKFGLEAIDKNNSITLSDLKIRVTIRESHEVVE